jgi:hypothetical protein
MVSLLPIEKNALSWNPLGCRRTDRGKIMWGKTIESEIRSTR